MRLPFARAASQLLEEATEGGRHYAVYAVLTTAKRNGIDEDRVVRIIEREADVLDYVGPEYLERTLDRVFGQPDAEIPSFVRYLATSQQNLIRRKTSR